MKGSRQTKNGCEERKSQATETECASVLRCTRVKQGRGTESQGAMKYRVLEAEEGKRKLQKYTDTRSQKTMN